MKISTRGRYALRALMYLAMHKDKKDLVILKDISDDQDISIKYLESIMRMLVSFGLVTSHKGKGGGLALAKAPSEIKFSDILEASEGPLVLVDCVDKPDSCKRSGTCGARMLWEDYSKVFYDHFSSVTLEDLIKKYCAPEKLQEAHHG
jgi:Rrf2 family protein